VALGSIPSPRERVLGAVQSLFSHGPDPLADTLRHAGDPVLFGPDSVSWRVVGDASVFIGGVRALVVQTAHPEVVAGVEQHSRYRADPLGRLSRTAAYVTATTFGSMPEVDAAIAAVRRAHRPVAGSSSRGLPYSAGDPALAAWVHNALVESLLVAHQAFGRTPLDEADADRFVAEQAQLGRLLGADPLPTTARDLSAWVIEHPAIDASSDQRSAMSFLRTPPLSLPVLAAYWVLLDAAVSTIPSSLRHQLGLVAPPLARATGRRAVAALRWTLGTSPAEQLAAVRTAP